DRRAGGLTHAHRADGAPRVVVDGAEGARGTGGAVARWRRRRAPVALAARARWTHPHPSPGRVRAERGYRYYADRLLERLEPQPEGFPLDLSSAKTEVDNALQADTEALSGVERV